MDKKTFDEFRRVVYEKSGITLHEGKEALVAARTGKRMRALGIENHRQYLDYILHDRTGSEVIQLLDVISTNVTHFSGNLRISIFWDSSLEFYIIWAEQNQNLVCSKFKR